MAEVRDLTKADIEAALRDAGGVKATAAQRLGVSPRTLNRRISQLGDVDPWREDDANLLRALERRIAYDGLHRKNGPAIRKFLTHATIRPYRPQLTRIRKSGPAASDE